MASSLPWEATGRAVENMALKSPGEALTIFERLDVKPAVRHEALGKGEGILMALRP